MTRLLRMSVFTLLSLSFLLIPSTPVSAVGVEQDDCLPGFIVNAAGTGCIEANDETDPEDCANAGTADAIEQCLADARTFGGGNCNLNGTFLGLPTWYKYLEARTDSTGRCNPTLRDVNGDLNPQNALPIGIAVLEGTIRLAGLVAVVMIFVGSFRFITSQGSPEAATTARKTIINSLIGLVIVIVATSVVSYVGNRVG